MPVVVSAVDVRGVDDVDAPSTDPGRTARFAAGEGGAVAAVVEAARALDHGDCDTAVAVATDATRRERVALVLRRTDDPSSALAIVRASDHLALPDLLAGAGRDARHIALFALPASGQDADDLRRDTTAALRANPTDLPRWTLLPLGPETSDGMRGLAAIAQAVRTHVLPSAGVTAVDCVQWPFGATTDLRPWIDTSPRLAAAWQRDASGDHAILFEEARTQADLPDVDVRAHPWPRRLLIAGADTPEGLAAALAETDRLAADVSDWHAFADQRDGVQPGRYRAAILARDPADFAAKAARILTAIRSGSASLHTPDGAFFGDAAATRGKTAFIFPGQGAQYAGMLGDLCLVSRPVQTWFEQLQDTYPADERCPPSMLIAPPSAGLRPRDRDVIERALMGVSRGAMATLVGSLALHELLVRVGVCADMMAGYSNGENSALIASGAWRLNGIEQLFGLLYVIRTYDEDEQAKRGACLAVNHAPPEALRTAIEEGAGHLHIALDNCPEQVVLFGTPDRIREAKDRLGAAGALCVPLAFDRGHHTPVYAPTVARLQPLYAVLEIAGPAVPLYSAITAAPFPDDAAEMRDLASSQWARTVRFGPTVQRMYDDGARTFIEVGPGWILTGFVRSTLKGRPHLAIPCNVAGRPAIDQLLLLLGRLFVDGHDVDPSALRDRHRSAVPAAGPRSGKAGKPVPAVPTPSLPASPDSAAQQILARHFELMQGFLNAQERTHAQLLGALRRSAVRPALLPRSQWPMLGGDVTLSPGKLHAARTFTSDRDRFLRHHTIGMLHPDGTGSVSGVPVVPFAVSLEVAYEAGSRLMGRDASMLALRDVRATRWLALDQETLAVTVHAESKGTEVASRERPPSKSGAPDVHVRIWESGEEHGAPAFELVIDGHARGAAPEAVAAPDAALPIVVDAESFNRGLFHRAAFRALREVAAVDARGIEARAVVPPVDDLLAGDPAPVLCTPVALVDAASQLVALWLAQIGLPPTAFPFQLDRYLQWGAPPHPGEPITFRARIQQNGLMARADVDVLDGSGARRVHLGGLRTKTFDLPREFADYVLRHRPGSRLSSTDGASRRILRRLPASLVDSGRSIWIRVLASVALCPGERPAWWALAADDREAWLLGRIAAKEAALDRLAAEGLNVIAQDLRTETTADGLLVTPEPRHSAQPARDAGIHVRVNATAEGASAAVTKAPVSLARG